MQKQVWEYMSEQSWEKILEWRTCVYTGESFPVFEKEKHILDELDQPLPNMSPSMRWRNVYMMRNERHLYKRVCDLTGKNMLSVFPPEYPGKVFHSHEYSSDVWSPFDYGIDIDFWSDLKWQIQDFFDTVPRRALNIVVGRDMENCDYSNYGFSSKDCYMCQTPALAEKCYYSYVAFQSVYNFDTYWNEKCEISYESIYCIESYATFYCQNVEDSRDCWFCYDLIWCKNCIGCVWLNGKQYYILNEGVSEKQYNEKLEQILSSHESIIEFQKQFEDLKTSIPKKALKNKLSENVYGNVLRYSKNLINNFVIADLQDSIHVTYAGMESHHLLSGDNGGMNSSYIYNSIWFANSTQWAYISFGGWNRSYYLHDCNDCNDCIFCIWLNNQQYCIFNKQYSQEAYEKLLPKIIEQMTSDGEWGEFPPSNISVFGYNESTAQEYFLLDKSQATQQWFLWSDYTMPMPDVEKTIPADKIPDSIADIPDDILNWAIKCELTGQPFKITSQELEFYRKHNLPIPRRHPDQRHIDRMALRNPRRLHERDCDKCWVKLQSTYAPDREETVYCEECYNKEIY